MGMYSHPWTPALLGLTHVLEDLHSSDEREAETSYDALSLEGIGRVDVTKLVIALESICDCSFRV